MELDEKEEHVRKCEDGIMMVSEYEKMLKKERSSVTRTASRTSKVMY